MASAKGLTTSATIRHFLKADDVTGDSTVIEDGSAVDDSDLGMGVETEPAVDFAKISLTDQAVSKTGPVGTPQTVTWDVLANKTAAAVTASDITASTQINNMVASMASFVASSKIGSSSSQDLVSTSLSQQDNLLPTLAAAHA